LIKTVNNINGIIKKEGIKANKLVQSGKNANYIICSIKNFVENNKDVVKRNFNIILNTSFNNLELDTVLSNTHAIVKDNLLIKEYINDIGVVLDNSVHGHKDAKNQIQRIIGQWINGKNSGYCFGFEGPPGVGKTSLAKKGLSKCLKNNNGKSRPFSFVAIGGSSNGSILEGHSYTYVGSTWGKIVDILIDSKCMNPIIFIDELDKISKTENGKEIIGILTHLIDSTQNDKFQDKYFCGIDLDLSKALFIFSYNDETLIDRILLDRIHRIKFDFLSLNDKLEIARNFILPDIYDKMGLENIISIDDDVIKYIIETYTDEAGVRKLKELIYEIMGEININILKKDKDYSLPIIIRKENIRYEYLRNHNYILSKCVNVCPCVGLINGLWANSLGKGGILPIEASFFPSNVFFELKLTGMQGDVMKESMNVAKTLAVNLSDKSKIDEIITNNKNNNFKGIHLHCPEGAVPKDGPSAGAAITVVIYSLLNNKKISNEIAITGEITLQGNITAIGGLDKKIMGGINAGVKKFLYPKDNEQDFNEFIRKYKDNIESTIEFVAVDNINDVIDIIILD
jgi:ATP-dependent Lon protease